MNKTSYINFGDRIILMKPMGRKFDVIGTVYEIGGITDTHYIIRNTRHRVAVGTILHNDFDTYFIKETPKKVWTDWGAILDTDGVSVAGYYRTNGKKVQVKRGKFRAEACCCKEDIFNLSVGINIALNRCIIKCCNNKINENRTIIRQYGSSNNLESEIEYLGNIKDLAKTELYKVLKAVNTKEICIEDIQEICAGDGIEKAFKELNISAIKKYDDGDYEIWWLSKNDYQNLNKASEDDWKEEWGWWRSSEGSNISDFSRHYFNVNDKQLLGFCDQEKLNDFIEAYSEDGVTTEELTESYFDNKYSDLTEYLCQELGASTATNVCAVAMDIAKLNHLTLADLFIQYEGKNKGEKV